MYNNILVFIVGGETSSRSEMHIFQVSTSLYQFKINWLNFDNIVNHTWIQLTQVEAQCTYN